MSTRCGANAVKLQKRDNASLYTREFFNRPYENENSYGPTYGLHREALEFGSAEYAELKAYAAELGVTFFATAFDFASAELLASLDMPAYKIASGDLTNTPLLRFVAEIGKPMILSSGGATLDDVRRAYETIVEINKQGTPILLVEQNALMALEVADRGYVLETGSIVLDGPAADLKTNEQVRKTYLGEG